MELGFVKWVTYTIQGVMAITGTALALGKRQELPDLSPKAQSDGPRMSLNMKAQNPLAHEIERGERSRS